MPPDSPQPYLMGRLDGLDVAAIVSLPETLGAQAVWATYVCVESTFCIGSPGATPGRSGQPGRHLELERAQHPRSASRRTLLPGGIRMGGHERRHRRRRGHHVAHAGRHAEFGAPEGFSDAITWMSALAPDDDRPAHWSIKFAVDDTRATAEGQSSLGGPSSWSPSRQRPCESPSWPTRREWCRGEPVRVGGALRSSRRRLVARRQSLGKSGLAWLGWYRLSSLPPGRRSAVIKPKPSSLISLMKSTPLARSSSTVAPMSSHIR
jgi:hypothetical protein